MCNKETFQLRAKWCAMGDLKSMFWMYEEFRSRLTDEFRLLEAAYCKEPTEENLKKLSGCLKEKGNLTAFCASAMWLYRGMLYGLEQAKDIIGENPCYQKQGEFLRCQLPGNGYSMRHDVAQMAEMGFMQPIEDCSLNGMDRHGVYIGCRNASYGGMDESGFGMEEYYDFYFFDEFFQCIGEEHGASRNDIACNRERIQEKLERKKEEKQREREQFWEENSRRTDMERYHMPACEVHGALIAGGTLLQYIQDGKLLGKSGEHVRVPDGVTKIAYSAFANQENIVSIELPGSILEIEDYAFEGCKGLKRFAWPPGAPIVPRRAFFHCHALEEVILPETVREIRSQAFFACDGLKKFVFLSG